MTVYARSCWCISYPETQLTYSRLPRSEQPSISSLRNEIQAHLRSTLLSRLMVWDLTPHAYSIQRPILTSRDQLLSYDPTPGTPLNCAYPLRITLEWFILLHSKHIWSFLNALNLWLPAHRVSILQTLNFRFRRGSSRSTPANIWSYAWSGCEGRC
jgi:hypothetical protein